VSHDGGGGEKATFEGYRVNVKALQAFTLVAECCALRQKRSDEERVEFLAGPWTAAGDDERGIEQNAAAKALAGMGEMAVRV